MIRKLVLCISCWLYLGIAFGQSDEHAIRISNIIKQSELSTQKGDTAGARKALMQALEESKRYQLAGAEGDAYYKLGYNAYDDPSVPWQQKVAYYQFAVAAYQRAGDWNKAGTARAEVGKGLENAGELGKAIAYLKESVEVGNLHHSNTVPALYAYLGMLHNKNGNQALGIKYGLLAVKTGEALGDGTELSDIYNNLAVSYYSLLQFDSAYSYLKKAISAAEQSKDTSLILANYFNLITLLPDLNRQKDALPLLNIVVKKYPTDRPDFQFNLYYLYANAYLDAKQYKQAGLWFSKILTLDKMLQPSAPTYDFFLLLATRYYLFTGQFKQAKTYLRKREEVLEKNYSIREHCSNEKFWFVVDSAAGNYQSAIGHYQEYVQLMDSIFSLEKTKQLNEMEIVYHTAQKDKDIKLLQQGGLLKDTTIQKQAIVRNIIILSAVLLLLLLLMSYRRYQLKQRTNQKLQQKQDEINNQNDQLKQLLKDKEWLLKEIHHRVKNNLQIVISLLNTQSAYLDNEDALMAIADSQHRMQAMSLIHQKLYQSDNMAMIDMQWYIRMLVGYMQESFSVDQRIQFVLDLDKIELDVVQAVPMGLILNEAISNAIKYAFPGDRRGLVTIALKMTGTETCQLLIADNGVGMPAGFDLHKSESLGMSLMVGLSDQLGGKFEMNNTNGTKIQVAFILTKDLTPTNDLPNL